MLLPALPAGLWGFVLATPACPGRGGVSEQAQGQVQVVAEVVALSLFTALCGCCGSEGSVLATGRVHPVFICAWRGVKSLERV